MTIVHTPVPVNVTNRVVRVQPLAQQFQIINTDLNATVWAANNASIVPGQGTPIPSGTSLTWQSPGDVYLILGNDALSITAAKAAVIISYDVADWSPSPAAIAAAVLNSGVLIIDQPVVITANTGSAAFVGPFDVSRYNSLDILCGTVAAVGVMNLFWTVLVGTPPASQIVHSERIYFNRITTPFQGSFPVRGSQLLIQTTFNLPYTVTSSNRQLDHIFSSSDGNITGIAGNLLLDSQQIVPASSSGTKVWTETPYYGEVEVYSIVGSAGTPIAASTRLDVDLGASVSGATVLMLDGAGGSFVINAANVGTRQRMACQGKQIGFTMQNATAAQVTWNLSVSPLQQQPG